MQYLAMSMDTLNDLTQWAEEHPAVAVAVALIIAASSSTISIYFWFRIFGDSQNHSSDNEHGSTIEAGKVIENAQAPVFKLLSSEMMSLIEALRGLTTETKYYREQSHESTMGMVGAIVDLHKVVKFESESARQETREALREEIKPLVEVIERNTIAIEKLANSLAGGQPPPAAIIQPAPKKTGQTQENRQSSIEGKNYMNNLPAIFTSKRFWSAVFAVLVMVLVNFVPELEPMAADLTEALTIIAVALIGGYTVVDVVSELQPYRRGIASGIDFAINQIEKAAGENIVDDMTQKALIAFLRGDVAKG